MEVELPHFLIFAKSERIGAIDTIVAIFLFHHIFLTKIHPLMIKVQIVSCCPLTNLSLLGIKNLYCPAVFGVLAFQIQFFFLKGMIAFSAMWIGTSRVVGCHLMRKEVEGRQSWKHGGSGKRRLLEGGAEICAPFSSRCSTHEHTAVLLCRKRRALVTLAAQFLARHPLPPFFLPP